MNFNYQFHLDSNQFFLYFGAVSVTQENCNGFSNSVKSISIIRSLNTMSWKTIMTCRILNASQPVNMHSELNYAFINLIAENRKHYLIFDHFG